MSRASKTTRAVNTTELDEQQYLLGRLTYAIGSVYFGPLGQMVLSRDKNRIGYIALIRNERSSITLMGRVKSVMSASGRVSAADEHRLRS